MRFKLKRSSKKNFSILIPLSIFLLALVLRLWNFSDIEFKLDQSLAIYKATLFWSNKKLPLAGLVSSLNTANPPLFIYFLLLPVLFSQNPLFITFLFALAGSFSVLVFYRILKKYSPILAVFSSLLFSTAAWPIVFSRSIWAQNLLPLFSVLILFFADRLYFKKKDQAILPLIVLSLWIFQIHFSGFSVLPFVLIIIFLSRRRIKIKSFILGLIIGLLPLVPWFFLQFRDGFIDLIPLFTRRPGNYFDINSLINPFRIVAGFNFESKLHDDYLEFSKTLPFSRFIWGIFYFQVLLTLAGFFLSLFKEKKFILFNLFFISMIILSFFSRTEARVFYEEQYFPLIFAYAGVSLLKIFQVKRFGKIIALSTLTVCLVANLIFIIHFFNFVHRKEQISGDYDLVYWQKERLVQEFLKSKTYPENNLNTAVARVIFSIFNYDKEKKVFYPEKQLVPFLEPNFKQGNFN